MKPAKTLSFLALATMFPDECAAVAFVERILWGDKPVLRPLRRHGDHPPPGP